VKSQYLPSHMWTDGYTFLSAIEDSLLVDNKNQELLPPIPLGGKLRARKVLDCPLIVRQPSADIYTTSGRKRLLDYIGVPNALQSHETKILIVSFGGQIFRQPSSKASSRRQSGAKNSPISSSPISEVNSHTHIHHVMPLEIGEAMQRLRTDSFIQPNGPVATFSRLFIPGAPPANKTKVPSSLPASETIKGETLCLPCEHPDPTFMITPPTPAMRGAADLTCRSYSGSTVYSDSETDSDTVFDSDYEDEPRLLPDSSWIAVVCGASGSTKQSAADDGEDELPNNFFIAPKDVYMPDLTAVGDVLLGKLGYGTVSECVDACTPFVYVPRPLFIEEHGLRRLLNNSGVGVQLSQEQYEGGDWADFVEEAWAKGKAAKDGKREVGDNGELQEEGERMATQLLDWVREWECGL